MPAGRRAVVRLDPRGTVPSLRSRIPPEPLEGQASLSGCRLPLENLLPSVQTEFSALLQVVEGNWLLISFQVCLYTQTQGAFLFLLLFLLWLHKSLLAAQVRISFYFLGCARIPKRGPRLSEWRVVAQSRIEGVPGANPVRMTVCDCAVNPSRQKWCTVCTSSV